MHRSNTRARAYAPDPASPGVPCDMPGCDRIGEYRAPKSRDSLREYRWFCLDHVRAYNASWDFYKGMTPGEIEAQTRADASWQRPSWPLGRLGAAAWEETIRLHPVLDGEALGARPAAASRVEAPAELRGPLATLGLGWPVTLDAVKTRYKELAKRHHPDANGGDRSAEERLKTINLAYAAVRARLPAEARAEPGMAAAV